ncbi:MAG: ABC transporter permease [Candidatus Aminicenantes bacterium]|nr:ABC transporter permease [Candidatus Aminicenantes bacterium]
MTARKLARIVAQNLGRNRKNILFAGFGIVVGVSSFLFFIGLGSGIKRVVSTQIFPTDANRVQVVAKKSGLGGAPPARIDDAAIARLEAIPGVKGVYPRMRLAVPATMALVGAHFPEEDLARIANLPGISPDVLDSVRRLDLWLEIMADGIDPRLVGSDVLFGTFTDPAPGQPVPVIISKRLVEIYNASFAEVRHLPLISEILIPMVPSLPLTLNESYVNREASGPQRQVRVKLIGTSHQAILGGLTMPLATVRALNREFAGAAAAAFFDSASVEAASADKLTSIQEAVAELGFAIDAGQQRMAESVALAVTLVMLGFSLISLTIVAVAAVNIGHTFYMIIYERQREIGLLRAVGASRTDIRTMIQGEAAVIGIVGGLVGVFLGTAACLLTDLLAGRLLPKFPFKPDHFFAYPWWMFAGGVALALVFCLLGAFAPANRAARLDPSRALTGR